MASFRASLMTSHLGDSQSCSATQQLHPSELLLPTRASSPGLEKYLGSRDPCVAESAPNSPDPTRQCMLDYTRCLRAALEHVGSLLDPCSSDSTKASRYIDSSAVIFWDQFRRGSRNDTRKSRGTRHAPHIATTQQKQCWCLTG